MRLVVVNEPFYHCIDIPFDIVIIYQAFVKRAVYLLYPFLQNQARVKAKKAVKGLPLQLLPVLI